MALVTQDINIAKENTSQEILKKVGTLVPSGVENVSVKYAEFSQATSQTLLEVTGKGKLFGASVGGKCKNSETKRIKVTDR